MATNPEQETIFEDSSQLQTKAEDPQEETEMEAESIPEPVAPLRRSTRTRKTPDLLKPSLVQLEKENNTTFQSPDKDEDFYSPEMVPLIAQFAVHTDNMATQCEYSNGVQYILQKGLKVVVESRREAAIKEVKQLLERTCFVPLLGK